MKRIRIDFIQNLLGNTEKKKNLKFSLERINLSTDKTDESDIPNDEFSKDTDPFKIHCESEDGGCCR